VRKSIILLENFNIYNFEMMFDRQEKLEIHNKEPILAFSLTRENIKK